jgi:dTDP-4-dehydrorhamnose reductase
MKRLLITGGSGYLGAHLLAAAADWAVTTTYLTRPITPVRGVAVRLDLGDEAATRAALAELQPDVIIHTACSNRNADHIRAIVPAARHLAQGAHETGARLIHVSTDLVFDGEKAPYADAAPPAPLGEYARAKAEAEALAAALCPNAVIVRPSLIWSLDPFDHQTRWLVEGVQNGQRVTLFTDEYRCPTYLHDLVAALLELAARPAITGLLNLTGPQALSRWDFGLKLLAALGLAPGPNVVPLTVRESGLARARNLTLLNARAQRELKTRLRSVDEILGYDVARKNTD